MVDYSGSYATPRLDLGEALMEYRRIDGGGWIGTKILGVFGTPKKAATFSKITRETILQNPDTKRAARGTYNRVTFGAEDQAYSCENHGLEGQIDDSERELYSSDFDHQMAMTMVVERAVALAQEVRIKDLLFNTTTWTGATLATDVSASAPWATITSDVISHVIDACENVRALTGLYPDTIVMGKKVLNNLLKNSVIKALFPGAVAITREMVQQAFAAYCGLSRMLVGDEVRNSANKGATFSGADVWGETYVGVYVTAAEGAPLVTPTVGRTMLWTPMSPELFTVSTYREEQSESEIVKVKNFVDELVFDASFGHLLKVKA